MDRPITNMLLVGFALFALVAAASGLPTISLSNDTACLTVGGSETVTVQVNDETSRVVNLSSTLGTLAPSVVTTDAQGRATATFTAGTVSGTATITAVFTDESGEEVSASKDLLIDHSTPINISSLSCPDEGSVGSEVEIALALSDRWGNPVDNANIIENVTFTVGSPGDGAAFIIGDRRAASVSLPVDSKGWVNATLRLSTIAGENIVQICPPGLVGSSYITITGVADGPPVSIESAYASASCPADGVGTVLIAYTLYDQYGNLCDEAPVQIASSLGETTAVTTNSYGSMLVRYGPKNVPVDVTLTATAAENASVFTIDTFSFASTDPVNLVLAASPLNMKSLDVDSSSEAVLAVWVTDESGVTVTDDPVDVIFTITDVDGHGATLTADPCLNGGSSTVAQATGDDGVASVTFTPGAFAASGDATGTCTVTATATLNGTVVSRSVDLSWRNYPSFSVSVSASPSTVMVGNEANVTISLTGDGWEFTPAPADVMVCISRAPTMLTGYPDPMVIAKNATKYFAGLMEEGTDSLGLVSYGEATPVGQMADLCAMNQGKTKSVYNEIGYDPQAGKDAESYIIAHYSNSGEVRFDDEVTLDFPLSTSYTSFNDSVESLIPYSIYSKGQGKHSGDELRLALYQSITEIVENGGTGDARAVVVLLDDDWNNGGGGKYGNPLGPNGTYNNADYYEFPDNGKGHGNMWGPTGKWQDLACYASDNDVKLYVMLVDTPKGNGNGGTNGHAALEADLQTLAETTGGLYSKVTDEDFESDLVQFYEDITADLKEAAVFSTTMDARFDQVSVNDVLLPSVGLSDDPSDDVLQYRYVNGVSTRITNMTASETLYDGTLDDTADWADRVLDYSIGRMEYGQTWTATLRFNFTQAGTIGLFTDGASKISFSNAAGIPYKQDLPPVYITVVDQETADVFGTSTLSIPALAAVGDNDTLSIAVDWTLDYAGEHPELVRQRAQYQYSADDIVWDNLWHDFAVPAVDEDVTGDYDAELDTDKKNGYYRIRIHAWEAISGGAEAWRTTEQPVRVDDGKKIRMKLI
ncbi:von Willebrand factor, type A [Methanofollis liminatans DSM 4140]|uniref:von Willebrand factor, type A n=1 Tax=Methanofollis liminatans DSM 4140 TaxID=28892 RepID=J1ANI1_9EURY|nr:hypothetical protein [Methanofollis liminatans]EJG06403.1 von Willebrand factor, type A [Methanofollis liminatans DSM 4140]